MLHTYSHYTYRVRFVQHHHHHRRNRTKCTKPLQFERVWWRKVSGWLEVVTKMMLRRMELHCIALYCSTSWLRICRKFRFLCFLRTYHHKPVFNVLVFEPATKSCNERKWKWKTDRRKLKNKTKKIHTHTHERAAAAATTTTNERDSFPVYY